MRLVAAILLGSLAWCFPAASQGVDWRGAYIGAGSSGAALCGQHICYRTSSGEWSNPANPINLIDRDAILPFLNSGIATTSAIGGAAVGYNWKVDGLLLGVESRLLQRARRQEQQSGSRRLQLSIHTVLEASTQVDWARYVARTAWVRLRSQSRRPVTGGLAVRRAQVRISVDCAAQFSVRSDRVHSSSCTKAGWVLGAGIEHALDDGMVVTIAVPARRFGAPQAAAAWVPAPRQIRPSALVYTGSAQGRLRRSIA